MVVCACVWGDMFRVLLHKPSPLSDLLFFHKHTQIHTPSSLQVFKEEEEAVKVELHEGCGRIKLYWTMALADYRTLKGMIEFRETGSSK